LSRAPRARNSEVEGEQATGLESPSSHDLLIDDVTAKGVRG
jgi:hypothetical protein